MERTQLSVADEAASEVFISYHHGAEPDNAHRLAAALRERGCSVFIDDDIPVGTELPKRIVEAIRGAIVGLPVITSNYFGRYWIEKEIAHLEVSREEHRLEIVPVLSGVSLDYMRNSPYADWLRRLYVDLGDDFDNAVEKIASAVRDRRVHHHAVDLKALARAADGVASISANAALQQAGLPFVLPEAASADQWGMAVGIAKRHGRLHSLVEHIAATTLSRWDPRTRLLLTMRSHPGGLVPDRAWVAARIAEFRSATREDPLVGALQLAALQCVSPPLRALCLVPSLSPDVDRALLKAQGLGWVDAAGVFIEKSVTFGLAADALLRFGDAAAIASAVVNKTGADLGVIAVVTRWSETVAGAVVAAIERDLAIRSSDLPRQEIASHIESQARRLRVLADAGREVAALQAKIVEWAVVAGRDDAIASILGQAGEQDLEVYVRHAAAAAQEPARRALVRAMVRLVDAGASPSSLAGVVGTVVRAARHDAQYEDIALVAGDDAAIVLWSNVVGPDLNPLQMRMLTSMSAQTDASPRDARLVREVRQALARDRKT